MTEAPISSCGVCPLGSLNGSRCPFTPAQRPAQAIICGQGERHSAVYWIREGLVGLTSVDEGGAERSFTFRGPRALLCLESLRNEPSSFEVRALSPVKLCSCSAAELLRSVGPEESTAHVVLDLLLSEIKNRRSDQHWRFGSSLSRVARFVLAYGGEPGVLPYFQKQIVAGLLGIRPETFSRCIARLVTAGLIATDWNDFRIFDPSRLQRLADGMELDEQPPVGLERPQVASTESYERGPPSK